jgi:hypothetical protein
VFVFVNLWRIFAWGWGKTASPLLRERFEQIGRGVFLILAYQKSFRRPYLSTQTFWRREDF